MDWHGIPSFLQRGASGSAEGAQTLTAATVQFLGAALVAALAVFAAGWSLSGAMWGPVSGWSLAFFLSATAIAAAALQSGFPHAWLGWCNVVTLIRMALTSVLFGTLFLPGAAPWLVFAIACVAFAMDGLDGWLARRAGLTSDFGARFDMEVDSAFALVLAGLAVQTGLSPWIMLLGLPRYAFGLAAVICPWINGPLPDRTSRKLACVIQVGALVLMSLPVISPGVAYALAALASLGLILSFGTDLRGLWRSKA